MEISVKIYFWEILSTSSTVNILYHINYLNKSVVRVGLLKWID